MGSLFFQNLSRDPLVNIRNKVIGIYLIYFYVIASHLFVFVDHLINLLLI